MVNGIGGNGPTPNPRSVGAAGKNQPTESVQDTLVNQAPIQDAPTAQPTAETEKTLKGQMQAAAVLGQSQVAKAGGPAKSVQQLLTAVPPGSMQDKMLDKAAEKVATKTVPGFAGMDDMDKALTLSDIRVAILENKELSGLLGIKL